MTEAPDPAFGHALNLMTPGNPVLLQRTLKKYKNFRAAFNGAQKTAPREIDVAGELFKLEQAGIKLLSIKDEDYPESLRNLPDSPALLYCRGNLAPNALCLAVVGTRRASPQGQTITTRLVRPIAERGITIVSGLAYGIDSFAHQAALEAGGRTVAVLPGGVDEDGIYPREHLALAQKILEAGGALVSEYAPGTYGRKHHFLARNRIIAGLSEGTLVVECDIKSGALITAHHALEYNRSVYAAPGSILAPQSRGTNALIQRGAQLVTSAEDILQDLRVPLPAPKESEPGAQAQSPVETAVLKHLAAGPSRAGHIVTALSFPTPEIMAALTILEIKGIIKQFEDKTYGLKD